MRGENKRRADSGRLQFLFDLALMAVTVQAVGADVAVDFGEQRSGRGGTPGAGDAALSIDDHLVDVFGEGCQGKSASSVAVG